VNLDSALLDDASESTLHATVVAWQDLRGCREELEGRDCPGASSRFLVGTCGVPGGGTTPQGMVRGEEQFDPAGPGADNANSPRAIAGPDPFDQLLPPRHEVAYGLHGHGSFRRSGNAAKKGCRAYVDGDHVVGHRRAMATPELSLFQIDPNHFVVIEASPGKVREGAQVDVDFIKVVVPRDKTGKHSRIRGVNIARDHREANARKPRHTEAPEHGHVTVSTAD
jgi:hypothetical protein